MSHETDSTTPPCERLKASMPRPLAESPLRVEDQGWPVPDDEQCVALWDHVGLPDNIRAHSLLVAQIAEHLALLARERDMGVDPAAVRAAGLLHDIAKGYTIRHGGNHGQLGGAWTMQLTGNPLVAQGVYHHIYWPWPVDSLKCFLPLAVLYADKRVRHDRIVPLKDRYEDLVDRYGKTTEIIERIRITQSQAQCLEETLSRELELDVHACSFDSRRLV